jgi:hypothetical protein
MLSDRDDAAAMIHMADYLDHPSGTSAAFTDARSRAGSWAGGRRRKTHGSWDFGEVVNATEDLSGRELTPTAHRRGHGRIESIGKTQRGGHNGLGSTQVAPRRRFAPAGIISAAFHCTARGGNADAMSVLADPPCRE